MRHLFQECLTVLGNAFRRLEKQVPPPQEQAWGAGYVFRYKEQTIHQALILKLARSISGLHAVDILLLHGLLQEQASIHRILDEIHEDIFFLAIAVTNDQITKRHQQYLSAFFAEEFPDPANLLARHKKPNLPPRRKIRAYVGRILSTDPNSSQASDAEESVSSTYSGFVHASAPQVFDMYGGEPPHFHISGMQGTPRVPEYVDDAWNYFYRAIIVHTVVAKAFADKALADTLQQYLSRFVDQSGERANVNAKLGKKPT